ncbi:P-loop containing nucleoside triphosphate hydrolase protein [Hypoxylon trugodes]|uniref:P-loop containing nucleoside triphosphate hydrolase protein n=1 Tax=Hypoxylon trugodes TaxID=326681 RepID=UPI0021997A68|nr:P-loop containing nucleoside triphosphate hydrolase protein [Hypoxylon trugodes]KAI1390393.1 P-loop containing nucleoside triphosphate hydrolase protein [Hypoxylon trugodes]
MAVGNTGNGDWGEAPPKKTTWRKTLTFLRLLFCSEPTALDLGLMAAGTLLAIAAGIPYPLIAILFGQLVDNLNMIACNVESNSVDASQSQATIASLITKLVAIAAAQFVLVYCHTVCWNIQSQRLMHRLRDRYFRYLLHQDCAFFDNKHAGEVSARLDEDFTAIQTGTSEKVGRMIGQCSFFTTAYIVAFIKQPVLAGILVSLVPAFLLLTVGGSHYFKKFAGKSAASFATGGSIASEALSHIFVVQAFGAGPRLEAKFSKHMALARKFGIKKAIVAGIQAGLLYFIAYSSNALAYWQGSRMIADSLNGKGNATFGQVYTVVFLLVDACIIMGGLAPLFPILGAASLAYERLRADMDQQSSIKHDSGRKLPWDTPGCIELRDVSFSYPSRPKDLALNNVNVAFAAGKYTAIVGQSGSGKSTIAALLNRFYDPNNGTILIDGTDFKEIDVRNLRGFVSLVQQESDLFDRTIFENIALGLVNSPRPEHQNLRSAIVGNELQDFIANCNHDNLLNEASHKGAIAEIATLVQKAADLADLSFINGLEKGYGTQVGVGGKLVSGGQRQRIALARALVSDPKILVLDEATASLDSATEKRIQAAIDKVAVGRTVISIAHRLSTIKHADNIVVMRDGEVVEQGTYERLLERSGPFAHLASLQGLDSSAGKTSELSSLNNVDMESLGDTISNRKSTSSNATREILDEKPGPREGNAPITPSKATTDDINDPLSSRAVLSGMGALVRPDYRWLALAVPAAIIVGCTFTAMGLIFGNTVSALSACHAAVSRILYLGRFFGGLIFMLAVIEFFANLGSWSSFGRVSENLVYKLRILSFRTLMEQNVEWHSSGNRTPSSLLSVITRDGASIAAFSGSIIATTFSILVNFFVAIIVSHVFAWKIALVCLAMVPILLAAGIFQIRATSRHQERSHKAFVQAIGITVEAVNQIKTIASFSLEDETIGRYRKALKGPRKSMIKEALHTCIYLSISNSTGFFIYSLSYWWGSQLIIRGEYTQTQFYIVQVSMLVSATLWGQMFSLVPEYSRARTAASRVLNLINLRGDNKPSETLRLHEDGQGEGEKDRDVEAEAEGKSLVTNPSHSKGVSVVFRDVHFAYPSRPDQPILKGLSFTIQPGQFVGLVGPSGAGKSTIMGLIQRMYTSIGSVEIDGVDIGLCETADFRDNISVVPQDNALFNGSIKFNVGLGARPGHEATDAEIEEACRTANIHDTIVSLPQGYDTECGPNGSRLSGGQRQRLAIARALVRNPDLLLLDESTSALDAESERAVQVGLERIARRMTVIAITHRLHTVQRADVIFVVEGGRIIDKGSHGELMERSESYRINAMQQMLQ